MSNVINKTTGQFLTSVHTPHYESNDDYIINPTQNEITEYTPVPDLGSVKLVKMSAIDMKSAMLIAKGFVYDNHIFSTSDKARSNWKDVKDNKDDLGYYPEDPIPVSAQDQPEYTLLKSNVNDFYKVGQSFVKGYIDSGRNLKKQVNACSTIAEVDAILDDRV